MTSEAGKYTIKIPAKYIKMEIFLLKNISV